MSEWIPRLCRLYKTATEYRWVLKYWILINCFKLTMHTNYNLLILVNEVTNEPFSTSQSKSICLIEWFVYFEIHPFHVIIQKQRKCMRIYIPLILICIIFMVNLFVNKIIDVFSSKYKHKKSSFTSYNLGITDRYFSRNLYRKR